MSAAPYNTWYDSTYDAILTMADWSRLDVDVAKKMICVYGWMPQTIMGIRHAGGKPKWASFALVDLQCNFAQAAKHFAAFHALDLRSTKIENVERSLYRVLELLLPPLGSVVASKYLHFSAPRFIPMWDRAIRLARAHADSPKGFIDYMCQFKEELAVPKNLRAATQVYPANPIRGWDVINMRGRNV